MRRRRPSLSNHTGEKLATFTAAAWNDSDRVCPCNDSKTFFVEMHGSFQDECSIHFNSIEPCFPLEQPLGMDCTVKHLFWTFAVALLFRTVFHYVMVVTNLSILLIIVIHSVHSVCWKG